MPKLASNWIMGELARLMNERGDAFDAQPVAAGALAELIALVADGTHQQRRSRRPCFEKMYASGRTADEIVAAEGLAQVDDEGAVLAAVREVIVQHADAVAQYRGGRAQTFGFLVGQVMKASGGKANPKLVKDAPRARAGRAARRVIESHHLSKVYTRGVYALRDVSAPRRQGRVRLPHGPERRRASRRCCGCCCGRTCRPTGSCSSTGSRSPR